MVEQRAKMITRELALRISPGRLDWHGDTLKSAKAIANEVSRIAAIAVPVLSQVILVFVQFMQPGYNPLRDTISSMVWGPYGWLQTANFYLLALLLAAVGSRLRMVGRPGVIRNTVVTLLLLIGLGLLIIGLCPTNLPGTARTVQANIHYGSLLAILPLFPAACFMVALYVRGHCSRGLFLYTAAAGVICIAILIAGAVVLLVNPHWAGMFERVLLLNGMVWIEVLAIQIRR